MKWPRRILITLGVLMILFVIGALIYVNQLSFTVSAEETQQKVAALHATSKVIQFEGQPIQYVEVGDPDKPLVMFVHGSPGDWDDNYNYLADSTLLEHVRIISVTRPGYGESGEGVYEPSLQKQAAAFLHIIKQRSPDAPAMLIGHSFGGPVIARMAMDEPSRVASLILLSASIDPTLEKMMWFQYPAAVPPISWLIPAELLVCNREILALKPELEAMLPLWSTIKQPVTVIHGEEDQLVPIGNADFAVRMLTNAPVEMMRMPGLNHFILWSRQEVVVDAILRQVELLNADFRMPNAD